MIAPESVSQGLLYHMTRELKRAVCIYTRLTQNFARKTLHRRGAGRVGVGNLLWGRCRGAPCHGQLVQVLAATAGGLTLDGDMLPSSEGVRGIPKPMKPTVRLR